MKFRSITFENHPILGDCHFDFTDANGNSVDTIIIAGENGCGKTILLNELFEYNPSTLIDTKVGIVKAEIELNQEELSSINNQPAIKDNFPKGIPTSKIYIIQDFNIQRDWNQIKVYIGEYETRGFIFNELPHLFKRIYSDVEINFTPQQIRTVTAKNIDQTSSFSLKSVKNLATDITQLLIDINTLDDGELAYWVKTHRGEAPTEDMISVRMKRFTNAFHSMFESKRFKGIENRNGQIIITFPL